VRAAATSAVAFRGLGVLARFKFGQPRIGFVGGGVQARGLVVIPRGQSILAKPLALLFPADVLLHSLAHDPVRRPAARRSEALDTGFQFAVELEAGGGGGGQDGCSWVLPIGLLSLLLLLQRRFYAVSTASLGLSIEPRPEHFIRAALPAAARGAKTHCHIGREPNGDGNLFWRLLRPTPAELQQYLPLRRGQRGEGLEEGNVRGRDLSYLAVFVNQGFALCHRVLPPSCWSCGN